MAKKKYTVSMAIDGRVDIPVEADTPEEAFKKANAEFMEMDLSSMDIVDAKPVNAFDHETQEYIDKD